METILKGWGWRWACQNKHLLHHLRCVCSLWGFAVGRDLTLPVSPQLLPGEKEEQFAHCVIWLWCSSQSWAGSWNSVPLPPGCWSSTTDTHLGGSYAERCLRAIFCSGSQLGARRSLPYLAVLSWTHKAALSQMQPLAIYRVQFCLPHLQLKKCVWQTLTYRKQGSCLALVEIELMLWWGGILQSSERSFKRRL